MTTIIDPERITVELSPDPEAIILEVGVQGPPGVAGNSLINGMLDVDVVVLTDGMILVWDDVAEMWEASLTPRNLIIDAGTI